MTIRTHPQKNQIKSWKALVQKGARLKEFPQVPLILFRSLVGARELSSHPINVKLVGSQRLKHCFISHVEVAIGVIRRNMAFVPEKEMNLRPWNFFSDFLVYGH